MCFHWLHHTRHGAAQGRTTLLLRSFNDQAPVHAGLGRVRPPERQGRLAALPPDPRPPSPPPKGARMNPLITVRSLGPPGHSLPSPENTGWRLHPSRRYPRRPHWTPASDFTPDPDQQLCPESPITFPKQMWHVMGRVSDNVTFCTVWAMAAFRIPPTRKSRRPQSSQRLGRRAAGYGGPAGPRPAGRETKTRVSGARSPRLSPSPLPACPLKKQKHTQKTPPVRKPEASRLVRMKGKAVYYRDRGSWKFKWKRNSGESRRNKSRQF